MAGSHRYPWRFSLFVMGYYITNAVYQGFITVYFRSVGVSTGQISILMSAVPIVAVLTQPAWGRMGDKAGNRTTLLRIMALSSAALILCFQFSRHFLYLLALIALYSGFYTALQPMGDSIILESLNHRRQPFGPIRMTGTLSFAVASVLAGQLLNKRLDVVLYVVCGLLIITTLATFGLPKIKGRQLEGTKTPMRALFQDKNLRLLLIFVMIQHISMGYFYTFFPIHYVSLEGGNNALLGICYFVSSTSEIPFLLLSDRLFDKLGAGKLLLISCFTLVLRNVLLGVLTHPYAVMATQLFHSWGFIVMTVAMAKYISLTVPEELRASGQMLLSIATFGIARVIGNLGGGLLSGRIGIQNGFMVSAVFSAAALIAFAPRFLKGAPLNGQPRP